MDELLYQQVLDIIKPYFENEGAEKYLERICRQHLQTPEPGVLQTDHLPMLAYWIKVSNKLVDRPVAAITIHGDIARLYTELHNRDLMWQSRGFLDLTGKQGDERENLGLI